MHALVDIGANLTHESFRSDLDDVLARAAAAGVGHLIVTGTTVAASTEALALARRHPARLYATAGIHPHHATEWNASARSVLADLLHEQPVVAGGECGLDYFRDYSPRADQRHAFAGQLELAAAANKPVFLHQRDAHEEFLAILRDHWSAIGSGVAHCFTGGPGELEDYVEIGLHIGITGWICDERRGGALREAVARLPLDRVLIETDAPYLLPRDLVPKPASRRNEPALLPHVLEVLAHWMQRPADEVAAASTRNAERLFALSPLP